MTTIPSKFTENELAQQALFNLDRFSASIAEHVNVWLNVYDTDLNIVLWNPVAEQISGYSREEVLGHSKIWDWLYPDKTYSDSIQEIAYKDFFYRAQSIENWETRILCKNGEYKNIAWNSRSLIDDNDNIYGVITFGYDITDRKRAEAALQKANDELSVLYDIASVTSASINLDTILESSLERVLAAMESQKGAIHLWDAKADMLRLVSHQGVSHASQLDFISLGTDFVSQVFEQRSPLVISDMMAALEISNAPAKLFHTYLGVPIRAKGKVLGVISIFGQADHRFSQEEITLLTSIADQIGVAVENARLYQEAGQLAVMEERRRIARDLHDSVTQSLFSLTLLAEAGQRLVKNNDLQKAENHLASLGEIAQNALKEMRLLVYELRPLNLEPGGLAEALQQRLNAVERQAGIKAHLIIEQPLDLSLTIEEGLYYIIQEALNNALKHASAHSVTVKIQIEAGQLQAEVIDDGVGFDLLARLNQGGMGLLNMRERAEQLGGTLDIITTPEQGTTIKALLDGARID